MRLPGGRPWRNNVVHVNRITFHITFLAFTVTVWHSFNVRYPAVPRATVVKSISDATKRNIVEITFALVQFVVVPFLAGRVILDSRYN